MGTHVISPQGLNAVEWTGAMAMYMDKFGTLPSIQRPEDWKTWGAEALLLSSLNGIVLPNPYDFSDFETWAQRFVEILASRS